MAIKGTKNLNFKNFRLLQEEARMRKKEKKRVSKTLSPHYFTNEKSEVSNEEKK